MEKQVYTRLELKSVLKCGMGTIDRLIREGKLSAIRLGERCVVVPVDSVERFLRGDNDCT